MDNRARPVLVITGTRARRSGGPLVRLLYTREWEAVHVGDCASGIDEEARFCFPEAKVHRAPWATTRPRKAAGPIRNGAMLRDAIADANAAGTHVEVYAFPLAGNKRLSRGTWNCITQAVERGLVVHIHPVGSS